MPDHVKLVLTLDLRRALAERLSAQAIREGKSLDAVVIEILEAGLRRTLEGSPGGRYGSSGNLAVYRGWLVRARPRATGL